MRFNELDPYNHVNHSTYVTYFEVGRALALRACGVPLETLADRGVRIFIASLEVKYLAPASAGQRLVVETRQEPQRRRASTLWNQTVFHEGTPLVTASVLGALVNLDGGLIRRPDWLDDALDQLEHAELGDASLY